MENLGDFRRLAQAACLRIGSLLNQAELGRDVGLSQPQVHRFLNVLEASFLALRLPAYTVNRTKRLIKAPKLYWGDTAFAPVPERRDRAARRASGKLKLRTDRCCDKIELPAHTGGPRCV